MTLSYRIHVHQYETDEQFERLVRLLDAHKHAIDEIALFTEYWHHGYFPEADFTALTEIMAKRIDQLHAAGYGSVGINVLVTRGHLDEAWDFLSLPFAPETYLDGSQSRSVACITSPEFRTYILGKYASVARAEPDFVWVDDDIRLHSGSNLACFCDRCLSDFEGGRWTREALAEEFETRPGLRDAWIAYASGLVEKLLRDIEKTVHDACPDADIGLMTIGVGRGYTANAMVSWQDALGGTRMRPGGGFYQDPSPRDMIGKALMISAQTVHYPSYVTDIQYELENFPYHKLDKSVATVLNECALAFASGCNGIAFNALKDLPGSLKPYDALMAGIEAERPAWDLFVKATADTKQVGLYVGALHDHHDKVAPVGPTVPAISADVERNLARTLLEVGIPVTTDPSGATAHVLFGHSAATYSNAELTGILSKGAILDGAGAQIIYDRGLGDLVGVHIARSYDNGVFERYTDHKLNGPYAEDARDTRVSFWRAPADVLAIDELGVEPLAHLIGYDRSDLGPCAATFTNRLGGRVVTLGYSPSTYLGSAAKRTQMLNVADWASSARLPVLIEPVIRVTPLVRASRDENRFAAVLLNTSYDETGSFTVRCRTGATSIYRATPTGPRELACRRVGNDLVVTIPQLAPWRYILLGSMSS
ncbi:MAG TPA: hypothetical protein VGK19_19115 [Capsulimonadaceae bacterium]|jgi:hypothetical protein